MGFQHDRDLVDPPGFFCSSGPFGAVAAGLLPGVVIGLGARDQAQLGIQGTVAGVDDGSSDRLVKLHRIDVGRTYEMALATGAAFIQVPGKIANVRIGHGLRTKKLGQKGAGFENLQQEAVLGVDDFSQLPELAPGRDILFFIENVHGAPLDAFAAPGAGVRLHQLQTAEVAEIDFLGFLFLFTH
ncbi:hypothetical protein DESC_40049 [Desulfosarcina cetonica]|nr:hypothetical protein DESC_40049 [Desulfosarcina cetonica]